MLFNDPWFWNSAKHTLFYTTVAIICEITLGLGIAMLLNRKLWGKSIFTSVFLTPLVMTPVVAGIIWRMLLDPYSGALNVFLKSLGWANPPLWLCRQETAMIGVILVDIWRNTPFMILTILAALGSLPISPYEAAKIDGASTWKIFRYITLPLIRPILVVVSFFSTMRLLVAFDIIYSATKGGPGTSTTTLNYNIYMEAFEYMEVGYPAALSILFWAVILVSALIFMKFSGELIWAD